MRAMTLTAKRAPRSGESTAGILTSDSAVSWKHRGETRVRRFQSVLPRLRIGGRYMAAVETRLGLKRNGLMILVRQKLLKRWLACSLLLAACQINFAAAAPAGCGGGRHLVDQCTDCAGVRAGWGVIMDSVGSGGLQRRVAAVDGEVGQIDVAAVHRRWSPRHLRFGLREAWCFSTPPQIFLARALARLHPCPTSRVREHERVSTGVQTCLRVKGAFASATIIASSATDPPSAAPQRGLHGPASDAGWARITPCGWAWLGQDGKQKAGNSGLAKPRGDPLWARFPSADQVTQYFSEALDERPVCQGRDMVVFQRSECFGWGVSWRRGLVEVLPFGVGVRWLANDDFGLSELREFFEAGFFKPADTERFYRWLSEGGWHQESLEGGVTLKMGVLRGRRATMVEISWQRGG
jgi:hypothetical protein